MRRIGWISILLTLFASANGVADECQLKRYPAFPVTMVGGYPTIPAELDGAKTRLLVDTGAFVDTLSPAEATEFKLPLSSAPNGYRIIGGFGDLHPSVATIKTLTLGRLSFSNAKFLVGANDLGDGIAGALGENLYLVFDVEFDFGNGMMRFIRASHCPRQPLAYWAAGTGQHVSVVQLQGRDMWLPQLRTTVQVNGHDVYAIIDTGASSSFIAAPAAEKAGLWPDSPGAVRIGATGEMWSAPVREIRIGDEKIENTHILVRPFNNPLFYKWMFIGADFFLSHHVYLATSQAKLYFTYNGGPVFDLSAAHAAQDTDRAAAAIGALAHASMEGPTAATVATPSVGSSAGNAITAAALIRRGLANSGRLQFQQAIDDLSEACRMAPQDANCRYQRGVVYWRNRQIDLALQDFDAAVKLDPGNFQARLSRAEVRLFVGPTSLEPSSVNDSKRREIAPRQPSGWGLTSDFRVVGEARVDLDSVDRLAPSEADLRLPLGRDYEHLRQYSQAVHQYDLWITYHPEDYRLAEALAWRCESRALGNMDLGQALQDCNRAYGVMNPSWWSSKSRWQPSWIAAVLDMRSVIYLRQGNFGQAAADGSSAIKLQADDAYAFYARGLAELREGLRTQGHADLTVAEKVKPGIDGDFARIGLTP